MRKDEEVNRALAAYENAVASVNSSKDSDEPSANAPPMNQNWSFAKVGSRKARPDVDRRDAITAYSPWELIALIEWIESDGRLRTDEEIIEELLPELGFQRRGTRIEGVLKSILDTRKSKPRGA